MNEIINLGNGQFVKVVMLKGERGSNIATITKTGTSGLTDTYTITLSDGSTTTFQVKNGRSIVSITKTGTYLLTDTYTITYNDGTTSTFTVENGGNSEELNIYHSTGNYLADTDTSEGNVLLKTMYGMSVQDGTPTPSVPVAIKNAKANFKCVGKNLAPTPNSITTKDITFTVNSDGSVTINGTSSGTNANCYLSIQVPKHKLPFGRYTISLKGVENDTTSQVNFHFVENTSTGAWKRNLASANASSPSTTFNYSDANDFEYYSLNIQIGASGTTINNLTVYPMLTFEGVNQAFELYDSKEVVTNIEGLSMEVSSGDNYNLVKDGKYYIADTIEWNEDDGFKHVHRIAVDVYDGSEDENWIKGSNNTYNIFAINKDNMCGNVQSLSNRFISSTQITGIGIVWIHNSLFKPYFVHSVLSSMSVSDWRTWLASNNVVFQYVLPTPIVESITPEQAMSLLSLRTYNTATFISQSEDVESTVVLAYGKTETSADALTGHNESYKAQEMEAVFGCKNILPFPYVETTKTMNGITFTVNDDGTITVDGTCTANNTYISLLEKAKWSDYQKFVGKMLTLSGCIDGGSNEAYYINFWGFNSAGSLRDYGKGATGVFNPTGNFGMTISIQSGATFKNAVFKPMLRLASINSNTYTPYAKSNFELTKDTKALKESFGLSNLTIINNVSIPTGSAFVGEVDLSELLPTGAVPIAIAGWTVTSDHSNWINIYHLDIYKDSSIYKIAYSLWNNYSSAFNVTIKVRVLYTLNHSIMWN